MSLANPSMVKTVDPLVWEFTGLGGLKRFLTQPQYEAQAPVVQKWYRPICLKCGPAGVCPHGIHMNNACGACVPPRGTTVMVGEAGSDDEGDFPFSWQDSEGTRHWATNDHALEVLKMFYDAPAAQPAETALDKFNKEAADMANESPLERLRYFLSHALNGQDWLDVEPFLDALSADAITPAAQPEAWMTEDGERVVTAKTKAANDIGAGALAMQGYTVPLFRTILAAPASIPEGAYFVDAEGRYYDEKAEPLTIKPARETP